MAGEGKHTPRSVPRPNQDSPPRGELGSGVILQLGEMSTRRGRAFIPQMKKISKINIRSSYRQFSCYDSLSIRKTKRGAYVR